MHDDIANNSNNVYVHYVSKFYAVTVNIDGVSQINYALIQAPTFTSSYIQTDIKVHFVMLLSWFPSINKATCGQLRYITVKNLVCMTHKFGCARANSIQTPILV